MKISFEEELEPLMPQYQSALESLELSIAEEQGISGLIKKEEKKEEKKQEKEEKEKKAK